MIVLKKALKMIVAFIAAVVILSIILCFYSITPVHIENKNRNTDYVWEPNSVWVKMTEGIAAGKYDANGYNNKKVINNPNAIILGSSHMEATNVMQNDNVCSILNKKFKEKIKFYNLGISGHTFYKVCQYLPENLNIYKKSLKYVIIETSTVSVSMDNVDEIINHQVAYTESHDKGFLGKLQKIIFLRVMYQQIESGLLNLFAYQSSNDTNINNESISDISDCSLKEVDKEAYKKLFSYLGSLESQNNIQIVIFYHPSEILGEDGKIYFMSDKNELQEFAYECRMFGIDFLDMTQDFEKMYYKNHHVAHGFVTGKIATGHLNKYGHNAIANSLYDVINEMEKGDNICK